MLGRTYFGLVAAALIGSVAAADDGGYLPTQFEDPTFSTEYPSSMAGFFSSWLENDAGMFISELNSVSAGAGDELSSELSVAFAMVQTFTGNGGQYLQAIQSIIYSVSATSSQGILVDSAPRTSASASATSANLYAGQSVTVLESAASSTAAVESPVESQVSSARVTSAQPTGSSTSSLPASVAVTRSASSSVATAKANGVERLQMSSAVVGGIFAFVVSVCAF